MAEGRPNLRGETPYWNDVTVKTILRNEVYLGHMVQNKTATVSYKVHKQVIKPKADWIKVEHTHAPLVSQEVWIFHAGFRRHSAELFQDAVTGFYSDGCSVLLP